MWWPRAAALGLLALGLALAGCGFRPVYGPGVAAELEQVAVARIPERSGQILRNALLRELGGAGGGAARWRLDVTLDEARAGLAGGAGQASRVQLRLTGRYRLRPVDGAAGAAPLAGGTAEVRTSFNAPDAVVAREAAEAEARRQALAELAQRIAGELAVALKREGRT